MLQQSAIVGFLDLGGSVTRTFTVNPVMANGQNIAPLLPNLNILATITGSGSGILKEGNGLLQLSSGASTFDGGITLHAGGLLISASSSFAGGVSPLGLGALTVSGNNTVLTADGTARTVENDINLNNAATNITIGNSGAASLTLSGNISWGGSGSVVRTINVNSIFNGNAQTLSGIIGSSMGSGNELIKAGNGILAITGNNSMSLALTGSQAIQLQAGTLQINSDGALGLVPSSVVSDNIVLAGGALSGAGTFTLNANRGISVVGGSAVFDATGSNTLTILSAITSATPYTVTKTGTGTVVLGSNTPYTNLGSTTIGAGTLALNVATYPHSAPVTVANNAGLGLRWDGSAGGGEVETFTFGTVIFQGSATVNVNRLGTAFAPLFSQAANKIFQLDMNNVSFLTPNATLTVVNTSGYGVEFINGSIPVSTVSTYSVGTATNANVVQGLTLSSKVTQSTGTLTKTAATARARSEQHRKRFYWHGAGQPRGALGRERLRTGQFGKYHSAQCFVGHGDFSRDGGYRAQPHHPVGHDVQ